MMNTTFFSYLYWNPNPEIFHIDLPFLHRGILWYGFLFAMGFFIGYWIFLYLIRRYFLFLTEFRKEDISVWSELIRKLQNLSPHSPFFSVFCQLPSQIQTWCSEWRVGKEIPEEAKKEILKSFNGFVCSENLCPKPHKRLARRLLVFSNKHMRDSDKIKKRIYIEEACPCFVSIKKRSEVIGEKVTVYVVLGALAGARLGDLLFYQNWSVIARYPLSIFKIWEGGLASHGAVIGIFLALWILSKKIRMSLLRLIDLVVVPTALAGVLIRMGNFFNQEILGKPTDLPWGIVFGHPLGIESMGDSSVLPLHPVQLYEAIWYGLVFLFLLHLFKKHPGLEKPGRITGLFFVLVFGFRFCIEFLKIEQSRLLDHSFLTMGQWLSIPIMLLGVYLLYRSPGRTTRAC